MITIHTAGLNVAIDNQYPPYEALTGYRTDEAPAFTVRVTPEELAREDGGQGLDPSYLEYICAHRQIAERLPDYDAFVFHGACVVLENRVYLFTAPSGTGKTTHVVQWMKRFPGQAWVLNGDKPILRRFPDGWYACGTPWKGKENLGMDAVLPIQGICLLHRGTENRARPASSRELVNFLLHQVYLPRDSARLERFLDLLNDCCARVPTVCLDCTISPEAADVAWRAMAPAPGTPPPPLTPWMKDFPFRRPKS